MRCCVSFCVNNSEIIPDSQNVTFHRLPTEKVRRAAWIQALGIEERSLQTVRGPSICSLHFREQDFHTTKTGLWAVKRSAVPKTEQICIMCLDTSRRLFSLNYYNLEQPYENVTGFSLSKFDAILSPKACWECGQRLLNCHTFRDQSVRAQRLLLKLSRHDELLSMETIKNVNRKKHKLKSNLKKEIFEPNQCDYHLVHDENSKNMKTESSNKHVEVKKESIVYGSEATNKVKNEAAKLKAGLGPKQERANNKQEIMREEEFLRDDIDNDGLMYGDVHKIIKNDKDNEDKCSKNGSCKAVKLVNKARDNVDRCSKNDSCKDNKLLTKGIKVDVEFSNQSTIDHDMDFAHENVDKVNKNDCIVNLPDDNADIDIDENDDDAELPGENDDIDIDENYFDVTIPDENADIDIDENHDDVNLPVENDDIEMDVPDENNSDVVEAAIKSNDKEIKVKPNKSTLNVNKCKVKQQKNVALNKPKTGLNKSKGTPNKDASAGKVRKRIRKQKTESQGHYLRRKPPTGGMELFKVSVLTYEEQVADLYSRKDTSVYKNSTFKCPHCFKGYQFEEPYDAHMLQHTDKYGQFECAICGIHVISRQKLLHHLNMAHAVRYSCTLCPFHTRHRNTAKSHGRAHQGTKTKCPHCGDVEFTNLNSLMSHVRKKHPSACVCPVCGFSFSGKTGLTLHLQRKHQLQDTQGELSGPLCAECNIRFASQTAYEQHLAVSLRHTTEDNAQPNAPPRRRFKGLPRRRGSQTVTCEQCGAKLKGFKHYSIHFESQHRDKTRTQFANPHRRRCLCELCGRVFQNSSALKSHMLIHAGKKDVQCTVCDKRFYYQRQLTLHMDIHGEPKRTFDCPVCARSFTNKSNKNRHLWTHTQVSRPFKCHACPKTFVYPSERKFHINHAHANQPYPKKPKNRVRNSRPKHVKEAPYGQIEPRNINKASYICETSAIHNERN